jgi:hypothetical protein
MESNRNDQGQGGGGGKEGKVKLAISTTAGFFPAEGFDEVAANQKIEVQLGKAARKLEITNTENWVATVNTPTGRKTVAVASSYIENGLSGEVTIDWGPSEGGGGASGRR